MTQQAHPHSDHACCAAASGPASNKAPKTVKDDPSADALYTCPMHPEIRQSTPGSCPICGMALERSGLPTGEEPDNPELRDFKRRFFVGVALTLPVLLLAMGPMLGLPIRDWLGTSFALWLEMLLATPVIFYSGWVFLKRGAISFKTGHLNMFSLIAIGVLAAWGFSVVAVLAPEVFPPGFRGADGHVGVYFEAGAVIVVLVLLGQILELGARIAPVRRFRLCLIWPPNRLW
ncbi:hypothetical protein JCM17846_11770 [Iodidimonas nitroreducens]|uniref:Heavy metal binding domain-containing protein n=1 Tax=Iodidimonas nitroreducens TaxID=1236968 RepID=A0A5A7N774_9PROT|nr:heavy metal-binding domain-containing protein [Iodidimonas nitroreducens]GER03495.1 hypothetical protein JCM17846_11770 [Iodidimonas nitroreducens]